MQSHTETAALRPGKSPCPPLALCHKPPRSTCAFARPRRVGGGTYDGVVADRRRQPRTMNDQVRAEMIITLRRRGWTYKQIGQQVGLSANGVKYALHRVTAPGRYDDYCEEEVDHAPPSEEW